MISSDGLAITKCHVTVRHICDSALEGLLHDGKDLLAL